MLTFSEMVAAAKAKADNVQGFVLPNGSEIGVITTGGDGTQDLPIYGVIGNGGKVTVFNLVFKV